jgi:TFIIF-interacting CTD phosphatase-like protein
MSKNLFLLDLDHTLIYGSYGPEESAHLLFEYSQYLKIYERPFARELVRLLHEAGEVIVYTTAKKDYAEMICKYLSIQPKVLLSRMDCVSLKDRYIKVLKKEWMEAYNQVIIIDDSPQVWDTQHFEVEWLVPKEFRGEKGDSELLIMIEKLNNLVKENN